MGGGNSGSVVIIMVGDHHRLFNFYMESGTRSTGFFVVTLLELTPGNILLLAFDCAGWQTTMDLAAVTDGMINTMTYEAGGLEVMVPVGHRAKVRIVCSMLAHRTHEKRGPIDVMSITPDDFSTWRLSGYNPRGEINPDPVAPAVLPEELERMREALLPKSSNVASRKTRTTIPNSRMRSIGIHFVNLWKLLHSCTESKVSFKQTSSLLLETLTPMLFFDSRMFSCTLYSKPRSRPTRVCPSSDLTRMTAALKTSGKNWLHIKPLRWQENATVSICLPSCRPSSWTVRHGKDPIQVSWLTTTPVTDHYSDDMKCNMLEQALIKIPELDEVRNKIEFARAQGLPLPTFNAHVDLIEVVASLLDAQAEIARPPRRNATIVPTPAIAANLHSLDFPEDGVQHNAYSVNQHALYGNFEEEHNINTSVSELALYQCIHTDTDQEHSAFQVAQAYAPKNSSLQATNQVSLDCATWHNLPNEDKAIWVTLSPNGKSAIINGTRQRGLKVAETCKTVKLKYTRNSHSTNITSPTPTPIITDIESVPTASEFSKTLESNSHIQSDSAQENSTDTNYPSENFLVNLAKSRL
jgi:hypothetical protein